jgi:hypothetical protein
MENWRHAAASKKEDFPMKGISRIDSPKCHGWLARVYRDQKEHPKLFSDLKYGGKGKALQLAQAYVRKMERALPPSTRAIPPPYLQSTKPISTNTTGINGVSRLTERRGRKVEWIGYAVSGRVEGRPVNRRFLFSTHPGKRATLQAAADYRKKLERSMLRDWKAMVAKKAKKTAVSKSKKTTPAKRTTRRK